MRNNYLVCFLAFMIRSLDRLYSEGLNVKKYVMTAIVCALSLAGVTAVYSSSVGTDADPLVSKSYVDSQIAKVKELIGSLENTDTGTQQGSVSVQPQGYVTVSVPVGKTIFGDEGTELILRAGKGTVIITGSDGIADVTNGQNLKSGVSVTPNHLLVVPRNDGRGVVVSEAAWFLVKGNYTIK